MLRNRSSKSGFALVIALSLMAFVLVLLLSITTLVRVETGVSQTQLEKLKSQQNALLGVYVAVGELQKSMGFDQRVTARADIFDSNPNTLAIETVQNPYWLAAFKTVEPGQETQTLENLRDWSTDLTAADRIDWLVSARTELSAAGANPATTTAEAINGGANNVVTLARFEDNTDTSVDVKAGKLDIFAKNNVVGGQFAWWVADENAKFRINVTKDETVLSGQTFEPRWSLMAPHQSNPSVIDELSTYDVTDSSQTDKMSRVSSNESLQLIDSAWTPWTSVNDDDFTTVSQTIPVDVTQGRLKEDLTVYLETNASGLNDSDFIVRNNSDPDYTGRLGVGSFNVDYDQYKLPKFGMIKSWYETGMDISGFIGGTASNPRIHEQDQHGLGPVILKSAVYFGLSFQILGTGAEVNPVFLIYPKFTLWNPHNVPIAPAKYVIQVRANTALNTRKVGAPSFAARNETKGFDYKGYSSGGALGPGGGRTHFNWANAANPQALFVEDDNYPYLTFVIDNTEGFAPGETLLYTANITDPNDPNKSEYVSGQGLDYLASNNASSDFENHNELINEDTGEYGFFYIVSNNTMRADPSVTYTPAMNGLTSPGDRLRAQFFVSDTSAGGGSVEPSLSTKLYVVGQSPDAELLQFIDLKGSNSTSGTLMDWAAHGGGTKSFLSRPIEYDGLDSIMSNSGLPGYEHGYGYFAQPMGNGGNSAKIRNFNRFNYLAQEKHLDDTSITNVSQGRLYGDSFHTPNWYDGAYPASIPDGVYDAALGYDSVGSFGLYHHHSALAHQTVYPIYDYVRSETGLLSLGYLSNLSFAVDLYQTSFPFGNSEAHTHIERNSVYQSQNGFRGPQYYSDLSYLLNESMFDRFFVSTIPQSTAVDLEPDTVLTNTRHRLVANSDGVFPDDADLRASVTAFEEAAASVAVEGGFNVNSTSVSAWEMLLASMLGESALAGDGQPSNDIDRSPLSKKAYPLLAERLNANDAISPNGPHAWSSTRTLSQPEIEQLAISIVAEIKRRGPFLSIADFVNRRLVPNAAGQDGDYLGLKGTLQAAIDRVSTDPTNPLINNEFYQAGRNIINSATLNTSLDKEHVRGMPGTETGSRMFGAPAFLTQADVLSSLAPLLTVRGDTFTIRTYGQSQSGLIGNDTSEAWCEAVVQRIADPVDAGDSGGVVEPVGSFGRMFKIVAIRWIEDPSVL